MNFYSLTGSFYDHHCKNGEYPEILKPKDKRPYYILTIDIPEKGIVTFAIPLRSNIPGNHKYWKGIEKPDKKKHGLDYTKAVVITDNQLYINTEDKDHKIMKDEFKHFQRYKKQIEIEFEQFIKHYIKEIKRRLENPDIYTSNYLKHSALQYFHKELGIV